MTLPRRSFLKSIAAALAGATAIRSAVTPVAEAVEPLAEFPKKGPRIHSALLEDNIVDVQHDMMARLGREWADRVDRWCWCSAGRSPTTLPEGWDVHHTPSEANIRGLITVDTRDYAKLARSGHDSVVFIDELITVEALDYAKSGSTSNPYHNIAFGSSFKRP